MGEFSDQRLSKRDLQQLLNELSKFALEQQDPRVRDSLVKVGLNLSLERNAYAELQREKNSLHHKLGGELMDIKRRLREILNDDEG